MNSGSYADSLVIVIQAFAGVTKTAMIVDSPLRWFASLWTRLLFTFCTRSHEVLRLLVSSRCVVTPDAIGCVNINKKETSELREDNSYTIALGWSYQYLMSLQV